MKNKKVLIFSDCYIYGGSERLIAFILKNEYINNKFNLFFSYRKYTDYEFGLSNDEILERENNFPLLLLSNNSLFYKINCLKIGNKLKIILKLPFYIFEKLQIYNLWNSIILTINLLKIKPEIIHINNGGYPGAKSCNLLVLVNYFTINAKIIYQINNQAANRTLIYEKYCDSFINKHVTFFLNASKYAKMQLETKRNFSPKKIKLINNFVPIIPKNNIKNEIYNFLGISLDSFLILEVAFLSDRKGQMFLIDSLARLYNQNLISKQKVFCAFVGNGENMELLKDHIKRLNLESNIFLVGYQQNSDDFIAACDLFILPSIKDEDMPLVILSALGYGKTIIATDFAGISQVIENNINGLLLSSNVLNLTNNLSNAIFELYTNEGKRIELATNAKKSYVKYSPQTYGFNLNKIYEQVFTS